METMRQIEKEQAWGGREREKKISQRASSA